MEDIGRRMVEINGQPHEAVVLEVDYNYAVCAVKPCEVDGARWRIAPAPFFVPNLRTAPPIAVGPRPKVASPMSDELTV